MLYIHHTSCISAQDILKGDLQTLHESHENKLMAIEPVYEGIPPNVLRRMGKAVKITVGAALPLIKKNNATRWYHYWDSKWWHGRLY